MRVLHTLALGLVATVIAVPAAAQFSKPEDAAKYRQGALFVLGHHFARIGAMATGRAPYDAKQAVEHAELVAALAKLPMSGFGPGTDKASPRARPEIWTEQPRFKEINERFVSESGKLLVAAKAQNPDALKAAFGATAQTCKSCHDAYRSH